MTPFFETRFKVCFMIVQWQKVSFDTKAAITVIALTSTLATVWQYGDNTITVGVLSYLHSHPANKVTSVGVCGEEVVGSNSGEKLQIGVMMNYWY